MQFPDSVLLLSQQPRNISKVGPRITINEFNSHILEQVIKEIPFYINTYMTGKNDYHNQAAFLLKKKYIKV